MQAAHLGMTIRDTERTLDFYCRVLGAELLWRPRGVQEGDQTETIFGLDGARVLVSAVRLGGMMIEFFEFLSPGLSTQPFGASYADGGWKHLALEVEDIDATVASLAKRGVSFQFPVQTLPSGARMVYFDDPDGTMLELIQTEPRRNELGARGATP